MSTIYFSVSLSSSGSFSPSEPSAVGAGGLGTILFEGMRTQNVVKIVWGTVLSVAMVLGVNSILKLIEKKIKKKIYSNAGRRKE